MSSAPAQLLPLDCISNGGLEALQHCIAARGGGKSVTSSNVASSASAETDFDFVREAAMEHWSMSRSDMRVVSSLIMAQSAVSSLPGYLGQFHHKICNAEQCYGCCGIALQCPGSHCIPEQTTRVASAYQNRTAVVIEINVQ